MNDVQSEKIMPCFDNMSEQERESTLSLILLMLLHKNNLLYAAFKDDLFYKNRHLPTQHMQDLLNAISIHKEIATKTIRKGTKFYRARILDDEFKINRLNEIINTITTLPEEKIFDLKTLKYLDEDLFFIFFSLYLDYISTHKSYGTTYLANDKFAGYDSENSGVAPPDKIPAGRLNPEKIGFLYTAKNKYTAVCEVKPYIGQGVSIAELKTNRTLKMFDLTKFYPSQKIPHDNGEWECTHILSIISKEFKKPNYNNSFDYLPTQYITEYAKEILKYDGIYFPSSLDSKGINAVFFDSNACNILSSDIVHIKDIRFKY